MPGLWTGGRAEINRPAGMGAVLVSGAGGPPPPPPSVLAAVNAKPRAGVREEKFALKEGDVVISFPEGLSTDSVEDLDDYIQVAPPPSLHALAGARPSPEVAQGPTAPIPNSLRYRPASARSSCARTPRR